MRDFPLVWAGIWRHPGRTILVTAQIAVAFVLFGTLHGIAAALEIAVQKQRANFLYVNAALKGDPLPLCYLQKIVAVANVEMVNPQNFLVGEYQNSKQQVVVIAGDPAAYFAMNDYCVVPEAQIQALLRTRTGAIAGAALAKRYGWAVGDRVPLRSRVAQKDGSKTWQFDIVGIYEYPEEPDMATHLIINNEYFDGARAGDKTGTVARFTVMVSDADAAPGAIDAIDVMFANSSHETATVAEDESARTRLDGLGNLGAIVIAVSVVAFVALLLSIGTMMMNSIRERTAELALLRALGFAQWRVMRIVVLESVTLFVSAAAIGLAIAWRLIPFAREYVGLVEMPGVVILAGVAFAIALALICAWLPVQYIMRLRPAQALTKP